MAKRKPSKKRNGKVTSIPKRKIKSISRKDPSVLKIVDYFKDVDLIKKQKASLYSRRYYWIGKLKKLDPKKSKSRIHKIIRNINSDIADINKKLGIKGKIVKRKAKKRTISKGVITESVKAWDAPRRVLDAIKTKRFDKIILGDPIQETFPSFYVVKIDKNVKTMVDYANLLRGGTPFFKFIFDIPNRTLTVHVS